MIKKIFKNLFSFFSKNKLTNLEKEILEQKEIIKKITRKYIKINYKIDIEITENINEIILIASGSSYNSAEIISKFIESKCEIQSKAIYSSEIILDDEYKVKDNALYIFISQSGETKDTNMAFDKILNHSENILAVTNTKNSTLYNKSKYKMLTLAGTENAIASTKAMCAQTFCLFLIVLKVMSNKNYKYKNYVKNLIKVPESISQIINMKNKLSKIAKVLSESSNIVILANGIYYSLGKEASLKIKENTYINTSAYPMGEFLHGHMAILNRKSSVILIITKSNLEFSKEVFKKLDNSYNYDKIIISSQEDDENQKNYIKIKNNNDIEYLFSLLVCFQLLSLEMSILLNRDVDKPQGLSKIVK